MRQSGQGGSYLGSAGQYRRPSGLFAELRHGSRSIVLDKRGPIPYSPYVIRATVRRLGALCLLTAFLGGGFGLSDLDALLFHSRPDGARADVAHFDQPGGCGAHAERCVLALATARVASGVSVPVELRLSPGGHPAHGRGRVGSPILLQRLPPALQGSSSRSRPLTRAPSANPH